MAVALIVIEVDTRLSGILLKSNVMSSIESIKNDCLPLGLANEVKLNKDVQEGEQICWNDVEINMNQQAVKIRREMEDLFA